MSSSIGIFRALSSFLLIHLTTALATRQLQYGTIQTRASPGERCWSILINTGDTCETLSAKCGITTDSLAIFNPAVTCSALPEGKPVCCSSGNLSLPPPAVGSRCYSYTIRGGDTCEQIAQGYSVTTADIETYNKGTWGWSGCGTLQEGSFMCLSSGEPPMPVAIPTAVCGPQVPGTMRPSLWTEVSSLNPCPSDQCCSPKGQCGTGPDLCDSSTVTSASSAVVQTAAVSENADAPPKTTTSDTPQQITVSAPSMSSTTSASSKTSEVALIDIPLTFYHPEEGTAKRSDPTTLATQTKSLASKISDTETVPSGWSLTMFTGDDCAGNYMKLQGHNKNLEDSACLLMDSDVGTIVNDTSISCLWWTRNGNAYEPTPCSESRLTHPNSWIMSNGLCTVVENEQCDNSKDIGQTYGARGKGDCQNRKTADPFPFGSMQCYVG